MDFANRDQDAPKETQDRAVGEIRFGDDETVSYIAIRADEDRGRLYCNKT